MHKDPQVGLPTQMEERVQGSPYSFLMPARRTKQGKFDIAADQVLVPQDQLVEL